MEQYYDIEEGCYYYKKDWLTFFWFLSLISTVFITIIFFDQTVFVLNISLPIVRTYYTPEHLLLLHEL